MTINVRVRDGMCPDPTTGEGGATEGDIRGSFSDIIDVVGVKDLVGGHCAVTENSPAALSVLVAPGIVYIPNADYDELDSNQVKFWEAVVTVSTAVTITANTSGSARVDLVCAKMDTTITPDEHASNIATLVAVAGTPGAGTPATPDNHYVLATVAVANGASTIVTADITDSRVQAKFNQDYESVTPSSVTTFSNKTLTSPLFNGNIDGWIGASETWEYVSVDDPTGIFRVNADVTTKYSAGMRIKFTNGGNVIYGIITVVGAYTGGYTSITFLHQIDPTDSLALYLMANSAIMANYYSTQKVPFGFPLESTKWSVIKLDRITRYSTPTNDTWWNPGSLSITIPIGLWNVSYNSNTRGHFTLGTQDWYIVATTLSTTNNSDTLAEFYAIFAGDLVSAGLYTLTNFINKGPINYKVTVKTPLYILTRTSSGGTLGASNGLCSGTLITAVCAYL